MTYGLIFFVLCQFNIRFQDQCVCFERRNLRHMCFILNNLNEEVFSLWKFSDRDGRFPEIVEIAFGFFPTVIADLNIEFVLRKNPRSCQIARTSDEFSDSFIFF